MQGASNLDIDLTTGTIFSVLRAPEGTDTATAADFLQPGTEQIAAGFALYGAVATMVITLGSGVHGFTLDREIGAYTLTHTGMRIPKETHRSRDRLDESAGLAASDPHLYRRVHPRRRRAAPSRLQLALAGCARR